MRPRCHAPATQEGRGQKEGSVLSNDEQNSSCSKIIWLILPVVICLSQRLSHACLSTGYKDGETANGSLDQLWFLRSYKVTWITVVILELIHATKLRPSGTSAFIRSRPVGRFAVRVSGVALRGLRRPVAVRPNSLVTLDNLRLIARPCAGDLSFKCLPYQLSMLGAMPNMVITGNGESGFGSGEGA